MLSSKALKEIVAEARPIIERQLDDAAKIAGFRDLVSQHGGDWSALKALIKAQVQDEQDETGDGKRVKKILAKASFSTDYAGLLGWSNMNEENFSAEEDFDPITGEFLDDEQASDGSANAVLTSLAARDAEESAASNSPTAPASQGEAEAPSVESISPEIHGSCDANTGGDNVDASNSSAHQQGRGLVSTSPTRHPVLAIRPNCQHPGEEICGGSGRNHCRACAAAMREEEVA